MFAHPVRATVLIILSIRALQRAFVYFITPIRKHGFPGGSDGKEYACNMGDLGSIPGLDPWRRAWQPTPVFLPGESHGQRSLVGYSP